jgi:hypothetical protein
MLRAASTTCEIRRRTWCRRILVALIAGATLVPTGCVRRRLNVRSNPPGAMVFVDNQQIGTTPCSVDFIYYGTREIRLVKPGYETLTVNQPIPTPWYQIPPIDFVSENLVPYNIQDHRTAAFDLQPQIIVPTEQLLDRANQLRQETLQGAVVPAAATMPPPIVVPGGPIGPPPTSTPVLSPSTGTAPPPTFTPAPTTIAPPFAAPALPPVQPFLPQEGQPIVSPPLR